MKTIYVILIVSLIGNVLLILDEYCVINIIKVECKDGTVHNFYECSEACNDTNRYPKEGKEGGGIQILNEEARTLNDAWIAKFCASNENMIQCGMISKVAIDSLFASNLRDNILTIEMGYVEATGECNMVIGSKSDERYFIGSITTDEKKIYKTNTVCPTQCDIKPVR